MRKVRMQADGEFVEELALEELTSEVETLPGREKSKQKDELSRALFVFRTTLPRFLLIIGLFLGLPSVALNLIGRVTVDLFSACSFSILFFGVYMFGFGIVMMFWHRHSYSQALGTLFGALFDKVAQAIDRLIAA